MLLKKLANIKKKMKTKPKALYIHIPFCSFICDYCDFKKLQYFRFMAEKYLKVLFSELKTEVDNYNLETIYIGGGTPTVLEDDLFEDLLINIQPFVSPNLKELTVECNPDSLTENKLKLMKKYGVNRLSLGVESTDDRILSSINRKHTFDDVKNSISLAKAYGFNNINVDLILGLPNVTESLLKKDIQNILLLNVEHISCYSLSVNPHTIFYLNKIQEPSDIIARRLYDMVAKKLMEEGYIHYEISNWAKDGYYSKHNLTYWKDEQYYSVGLAASSYIYPYRKKHTSNFDQYIKNNLYDDKETEFIDLKTDRTYFIMLNLRTIFGLNLNKFKDLFNEDLLITKHDEISNFISQNLLIIKDNTLIPTYEGMMILDQILLNLI